MDALNNGAIGSTWWEPIPKPVTWFSLRQRKTPFLPYELALDKWSWPFGVVGRARQHAGMMSLGEAVAQQLHATWAAPIVAVLARGKATWSSTQG